MQQLNRKQDTSQMQQLNRKQGTSEMQRLNHKQDTHLTASRSLFEALATANRPISPGINKYVL
jgi:hypothetical protein